MASQTKKREFGVDLLKFIAAIMVVILHVVGCGNGIQEYIYLAGSYGIPAFFIVNGYLRCRKMPDSSKIGGLALRYMKFNLIWAVIISVAYFFMKHNFPFSEVLIGAFIGEGVLYHLWFLSALIVNYCVTIVIAIVFGNSRFNEMVSSRFFILFPLLLMSISFITNVVLKFNYGIEIRNLVPAPFRIVTNCGYYLLGLHFGLCEKPFVKGLRCSSLSIFLSLSTLILWLVAERTGIIWASSYYSFAVVLIGTSILFCSITAYNYAFNIPGWIKSVVQTCSGGIWILHPFIIKAMRRLFSIFPIGNSILFSCLILITTIIVSIICSLMMVKSRYLRYLITP